MSTTGTVVDLSSDGWGVVKTTEGIAVFVPGTWPGDEINFEIVRTGKFNLGKVLSWNKKSSAHRESPCAHWGLESGRCGACTWMGIHYKDQIQAKEKRLNYLLNRFKIQVDQVFPVQTSQEFAYRNRVKLSSDGKNLGFQAPLSHQISPIEKCLVAEDTVNAEIKKLLKGSLEKKEYWIPNSSFAQGNTAQNLELKKCLASLLTQKYNAGFELFCGSGNFTEVLLEKIKNIHAYESSATAINELLAKFPSINAYTKNLYSASTLKELISENKDAEFLFLDPPRSGYKELSDLCLGLKKLKTVIYLSCDAMTFARDISTLLEKSPQWKLTKVFPFDLFPQTPHLEVMGYLEGTSS